MDGLRAGGRGAPLKGIALVLVSALFFAASSAMAKSVTDAIEISSLQVNFLRFLVGLVLIAPYAIAKRIPLKPDEPGPVFLRVLSNTAAIILFFIGVKHTSVTKANMLNMTAPVFVFLFAPFINKEKPSPRGYLYLALAMAGVVLTAFRDLRGVSTGDAVSLASGFMAGIATSALREARKRDGTFLILFWFYLVSTAVLLLLMLPGRRPMDAASLAWTLASGLLGLGGQLTLTAGMGLLDASTGSLVSASRIIFAGAIGIAFFGDPADAKTLAGGLLILVALVGVSGFFDRRRRDFQSD